MMDMLDFRVEVHFDLRSSKDGRFFRVEDLKLLFGNSIRSLLFPAFRLDLRDPSYNF